MLLFAWSSLLNVVCNGHQSCRKRGQPTSSIGSPDRNKFAVNPCFTLNDKTVHSITHRLKNDLIAKLCIRSNCNHKYVPCQSCRAIVCCFDWLWKTVFAVDASFASEIARYTVRVTESFLFSSHFFTTAWVWATTCCELTLTELTCCKEIQH